MPTVINYEQNNFASGQVSPKYFGRTDLDAYASFLRKCRNFVMGLNGSPTRRAGSVFVKEAKFPDKTVRLYPFIFSNDQSYILEFGDYYIRFFKNEAALLSGSVHYEIASPYAHTEVSELDFAHQKDVVYITHPNYPIQKLSRFGHTNWTIAPLAVRDGAYLEVNTTGTVVAVSGASGTVALTSNASLFSATDVGRLVRLSYSGTWSWGVITAYVSPTQVTFLIKGANLPVATATSAWRLGAWSSALGYPSRVTFHQGRLVFANSPSQPQTFWCSVSGDIENFAPTQLVGTVDQVQSTSAITATLNSNGANSIYWVRSDASLLFGTERGVFASNQDLLSPANIQVSLQRNVSCAESNPVITAETVLFLQKIRRRCYSLAYSNEARSYLANDLTLFSDTITTSGVRQMVYLPEPHPVVAMRTADNRLLWLTLSLQQKMVAWADGVLGGTYGENPPELVSIAAITDTAETYSQLWMVVRRTIDGQTKTYIEYLSRPYEATYYNETTAVNAVFCDSSLTQTFSSEVNQVSNLDHLEGQDVVALLDGSPIDARQVVDGAIDLPYPALKVTVGLPYISELETVDVVGGNPKGSSAGAVKRIDRVRLRVFESLGFEIYNPLGDRKRQYVQVRRGTTPLNKAVQLVTGYTEPILHTDDSKEEVSIGICVQQPVPLTILGIAYNVSVAPL